MTRKQRRTLKRIAETMQGLLAMVGDLQEDAIAARDNVPEGLRNSPIYIREDITCQRLDLVTAHMNQAIRLMDHIAES